VAPKNPRVIKFMCNNRLTFAALLSSIILLFSCSSAIQVKDNPYSTEFVMVKGGHFYQGDKNYVFVGTNFWHAGYLGLDNYPGNREQLKRELDLLKAHGITNLRVLAMAEASDLKMALRPAIQSKLGQIDQDLLVGLDFLLVEMAKRDMKAVLFLNNFWQWSGGMSQYVSWLTGEEVFDPDVTGDWNGFMQNSARFYHMPEAQQHYQNVIKQVITRVNTINGLAYNQDPTIMTWELANEPRPGSDQDGRINVAAYIKWIDQSAQFIHALAPHQLVTTGSEGIMGSIRDPEVFLKAHQLPSIDYATFHLWLKNWGWFNVKQPDDTYPAGLVKAFDYIDQHIVLAKQLNKPMVLEEFGVERDNGDFSRDSSTLWRDKLLTQIYQHWYQAAKAGEYAAGSNFWAWSGEATTSRPDYIWQNGDMFFGDPPQEPQGLNSVFDTDISTLELIEKHAQDMKSLVVEASTN
jgi:mannan endo-1,4-beta-mannosidase